VWLLVFVASLTPTGALVGIAVAMVCMSKHRLLTFGLGVFYLLPWAIPGIIATFRGGQDMDPQAAAAAFAPRAEEAVGTLGALLGLGGIWNADAVPESRHLGFALLVLESSRAFSSGYAMFPRASSLWQALVWALRF